MGRRRTVRPRDSEHTGTSDAANSPARWSRRNAILFTFADDPASVAEELQTCRPIDKLRMHSVQSAGLTLRAEQMQRGVWWWAVYDERSGAILGDSNSAAIRVPTGKKARIAAERAAQKWLGREDAG